MKKFSELHEISSRTLSKYVKLAEPVAKATGAVGTLTGDVNKISKADSRLEKINKAKSKLNNMTFNKPVYEEQSSIDDALNDLNKHVSNPNPTPHDIGQMHIKIYDLWKTHGIHGNDLYDKISSNDKLHQKFRDAASLE